MAIFNSYVSLPEGIALVKNWGGTTLGSGLRVADFHCSVFLRKSGKWHENSHEVEGGPGWNFSLKPIWQGSCCKKIWDDELGKKVDKVGLSSAGNLVWRNQQLANKNSMVKLPDWYRRFKSVMIWFWENPCALLQFLEKYSDLTVTSLPSTSMNHPGLMDETSWF